MEKNRVLHPYQVQALDMYIDIDNMNDELLSAHSPKSNCLLF